MLYAKPARNLHDVECADHIGIEIGAGVLQAVSHTGLCCEVDDHIGRKFIGDTVEECLIFQHPLGRGEVRVLQQHLVPPLLKGDIVIISHPVIAVDDKSFGQKQLGKVEPDEPGSPSDQNTFFRINFSHLFHSQFQFSAIGDYVTHLSEWP